MTIARTKVLGLLLVGASAAGCDLPPSDIGRSDIRSETSNDQLEGLVEIVDGNSVRLKTSASDYCASFTGSVRYTPDDQAVQLNCSLVRKTAGTIEEPKGSGVPFEIGICRLSFGAGAGGARALVLQCADGEGPHACFDGNTEVGRLTTAVDFAALALGVHDGLVVKDDVDPSVSAEVHESFDYCDGEFSDEDSTAGTDTGA